MRNISVNTCMRGCITNVNESVNCLFDVTVILLVFRIVVLVVYDFQKLSQFKVSTLSTLLKGTT